MIVRRVKLKNFQIYRDFEASFSALTFIKGNNGCFVAGTKVMMSDYTWKNIEDIKIGDSVIGFNEYGRRMMQFTTVVNKFERQTNETIKIATDRNNSIEGTKEHPFLFNYVYPNKESYSRWVELGKLKFFTRGKKYNKYLWNIPIEERNKEWKKGWLLGFLMGDGSMPKDRNNVLYYNKNKDFIWFIKCFAYDLYNIRFSETIKNTGVIQLTANNKKVRRIFSNQLANLKDNKSEDFLRGVVAGFYDADGTAYKAGQRGISLINTNFDYLLQLQKILHRFKIGTNIHLKRKEGKSTIREVTYKTKTLYELTILDQNKFRFKILPFKTIKYKYHIASLKDHQKIVDYKINNETKKVYNLETEIGTYVANGFPVHNCGKTTLGLEAIMFCLFGYSAKNLGDIPTLNKSKSCSVEVELEHMGHVYVVERKIPTNVKIIKDGQELQFENSTEAGSYLKDMFGEPLNFKKFRMIDNEVGINFLDPKQATTLKKIIFSVSEDIFNEKKDLLQKIKQEREVWNKDNAVLYTHFPSEKRLNAYIKGIEDYTRKYNEAYQEVRTVDNEMRQIQGKISSANSTIRYLQNDIERAQNQIKSMSANQCYACGSPLDPQKNAKVISNLQIEQKQKWEEQEKQRLIIKEAEEEAEEIQEMVKVKQTQADELNRYIQHLNERKMRLEARLKQKEYRYTTRDVEVAKRALKELDSLSTRFLVNSVKNLEPVINEVLSKIGHTLEFDVNDKGKFDIILTDSEGSQKAYKHLSTGQKLLLQIAFKLALMIDNGQDGLVIADEGFSSLDCENMKHILKIFEQYPTQLIFICHHFEDVPDSVKIIDLNKVINDE